MKISMEQEMSRMSADGMMATLVVYISAIWFGRISIPSGPGVVLLPKIITFARSERSSCV